MADVTILSLLINRSFRTLLPDGAYGAPQDRGKGDLGKLGAGMNLFRKKAPERLMRAIVALRARTGKKLKPIRNNGCAPDVASDDHLNSAAEDFEGYTRLNERTTITVETETLLIVRGVTTTRKN
jgi:hypothetical protein